MDILQEHLIRARASGGVFARSVAVPPWGLRLPGTIQLAVHAVVQGHAWLWTEGNDDPLELAPGDLALVRGGSDHYVAHEPGAHCVSQAEFRSLHADDAGLLDHRSAVFLCGAYRLAGDIGQGLVAALPPVLSLPASVDDPIHAVVTLLSREMLHVEPGKQTVLVQDTTLAEIADRVGYSSVYAFATAFRRHHGESPGRWRQREALATIPGHD